MRAGGIDEGAVAHPIPIRSAVGAAACLALATFATYLIGADRAFGYDASVTMTNFVDGPPSWAFTRQVVWNNHPVFSFVEGLVADVLGTGEVVMRIVPALCAAAAVGVVTWRLGVRWGWLSGVAAGLILAAHPTLIVMSRDARGYSLAVLAIVVMGVAVLDGNRPALFAAAAVVGVGTHLYAAVPFVALVAVLAVQRRIDRSWRVAFVLAALGVVLVYAPTLSMSGRAGGRRFQATFPIDAGRELLAGGALTVLCLAAVVAVAVRAAPLRGELVAVAAVTVLGVLGPWVVAPYDLYPRFVYWAIPALAVAVAFAVRAAPATFGLVVVAAVAAVVPLLGTWADDPRGNRILAARMGPETCLAPLWSSEAVTWYAGPGPANCSSLAVLADPALADDVAALRASDWPVTCWQEGEALILAARPGDCPR